MKSGQKNGACGASERTEHKNGDLFVILYFVRQNVHICTNACVLLNALEKLLVRWHFYREFFFGACHVTDVRYTKTKLCFVFLLPNGTCVLCFEFLLLG